MRQASFDFGGAAFAGPMIGPALAFNFCPLRYAHPARLEALMQLPEGGYDRLAEIHGAERLLSAKILRLLGVENQPVCDFSSSLRRLALFPYERIMRCARIAALSLMGARLRGGLDGAWLRGLGPDFSEDDPLIALEVDETGFTDEAAASTLRQNPFDSLVANAIAAWLWPEVAELRQRVLLRFPPGSEPVSLCYPEPVRARMERTAALLEGDGHGG